MSRSHPSTNPSKDPNDPFARLLGAGERTAPRPEYRTALRAHLAVFVPTPGLPIDVPALGRVLVRPVHAFVAAILGVAAIAGALWLPPTAPAIVAPPPSVEQPAVQPLGDAASDSAPMRVRPRPNAADRRALIAARRVADRPAARPPAPSLAALPDGIAPAAPPAGQAAVAAVAATDVSAPPAPLEPPTPAENANVSPPLGPSPEQGRDRDRDRDGDVDRDRPAAAVTPTSTAPALDPPGGAEPTAPALLPPEPAEPTQAPPPAMPTVPVAPTPTPGP